MAFIRTSSKTVSQPEIRAALAIAKAGMLALLRELAREGSPSETHAISLRCLAKRPDEMGIFLDNLIYSLINPHVEPEVARAFPIRR